MSCHTMVFVIHLVPVLAYLADIYIDSEPEQTSLYLYFD